MSSIAYKHIIFQGIAAVAGLQTPNGGQGESFPLPLQGNSDDTTYAQSLASRSSGCDAYMDHCTQVHDTMRDAMTGWHAARVEMTNAGIDADDLILTDFETRHHYMARCSSMA